MMPAGRPAANNIYYVYYIIVIGERAHAKMKATSRKASSRSSYSYFADADAFVDEFFCIPSYGNGRFLPATLMPPVVVRSQDMIEHLWSGRNLSHTPQTLG
jgi:hypothetical protein